MGCCSSAIPVKPTPAPKAVPPVKPEQAPPPPAPPPPAAPDWFSTPTPQEVLAKRAAALYDEDEAARRKEPAYIAEREEAIRRAVMKAARADFADDLPSGWFSVSNYSCRDVLNLHDHELFPFMKYLVPGYEAELTRYIGGGWSVRYGMA
jgi:hypothetical protein